VQRFSVRKYYRDQYVSFISFISFIRGKPLATGRNCLICGMEYQCREEDYKAFMHGEDALEVSMEELLKATNPALRKRLKAQQAKRRKQAQARIVPEEELNYEILPDDEVTDGPIYKLSSEDDRSSEK